DGIDELFLHDPGWEEPGGDASCVRGLRAPCVVRDHIGLLDESRALAGDELGIAGADADPREATCRGGHSASWAIALRAEEVMAEPPRRPRTVTNGMSMPCVVAKSSSARFDSAAPMNPTGQPTMAAGRGAPSKSSSSRWNSAVGALPIATSASFRRGSH